MRTARKLLSFILTLAMCAGVTAPSALAEYNGKPYRDHIIPGEVFAPDFDEGEIGETHSGFKTNERQGTGYRPEMMMNMNTGVYNNLAFNKQEWTRYTVRVQKTAVYEISGRYASVHPVSNITLDFDQEQTLELACPGTDSWAGYPVTKIGSVKLTEGTHIMTMLLTNGGLNLKSLIFEERVENVADFSKKEGSYRANVLPTVIQAEDYDLGAGGAISADGENSAGKYRRTDAIDVAEGDSGYVISLAPGEGAIYTMYAETAGNYTVSLASSTSAEAELYIDDNIYPVRTKLNPKGQAEVVLTDAVTYAFSKGEHQIRLMAGGNMTLDYIAILLTDAEALDPALLSAGPWPENLDSDEVEAETPNPVWKELYVSSDGDDNGSGSAGSPFATFERADKEVAALRADMEGDIIVNVSGRFDIDKTIEFGSSSGGANGYNVIYRGDKTNMPVVSGGTKVTGWEKSNDHLWKAKTDIADTRALYVNDFPAMRATSKYRYYAAENYVAEGSTRKTDGIKVASRNFPRFSKPDELELVWPLEWTHSRTEVSQILYETDEREMNTIVMKQPSWNKYASPDGASYIHVGYKSQFYIENALELLDEPGEFYFDKDTGDMYYYPYRGEDMTSAEVYAGTTNVLVNVKGDSVDKHVQNLRIENISFKYGAWTNATKGSLFSAQADRKMNVDSISTTETIQMPSQIEIKHADNVRLSGCEFKCMGSGAVGMKDDVQTSRVTDSVFTDISGTGVTVGTESHGLSMPDTSKRCTDILIRNNILRRVGAEFMACPAIMGYCVSSMTVSHNDIYDTAYSGVAIGWGWQNINLKGLMNNNRVEYNKIVNVMTAMHDGAHVYILGYQNNFFVNNNYFIRSGDLRGGIYPDEGATNTNIYKNVVMDVATYWLYARGGVSLQNINVYDNFTNIPAMIADERSVSVSNTTVFEGNNIPQEAVPIAYNAGVLEKERLAEVTYPSWRKVGFKNLPQNTYVAKKREWIDSADFDPGWEVGYYNSAGRGTEAYRTWVMRDECADVWISLDADGVYHSIGDTKGGDWFRYTIDIEKEGDYSFIMEYKNAFPATDPDSLLTVELDGEVMIDKAPVVRTGEAWSTADRSFGDFGKYHLTAGEHTVKIMFVDNGWQFYKWKFSDGVDFIPYGNEPQFDEGVFTEEPEDYDNGYEESYVQIYGSNIQYDPSGFTDMTGHWANSYVKELKDKGLIKGVSDTMFEPERGLSVEESARLAMRVMGSSDTADGWEEEAAGYGLLDGGAPASPIGRAQFAKNIISAYESVSGEIPAQTDSYIPDADSISEELMPYVLKAYAAGLMQGDDDGYFRPDSTLTRAEAATVLYRLLYKIQ